MCDEKESIHRIIDTNNNRMSAAKKMLWHFPYVNNEEEPHTYSNLYIILS